MKPFDDLTRLGRLRRMRQLAQAALGQYGMGDAELVFHVQAGNTLYRVYADERKATRSQDDLFEPGKYLLRIYQPGWQSAEALELELAWMSAMRHEAGLPLQESVRRLDGGLLTHVATPGIPEGRYCSLLRWIKGRLLRNYGRPEHYRAQGRLMARMHNFTQEWQQGVPTMGSKRQYDWEGLFMNDAEIGLPPGACWEYLPPGWRAPFEQVSSQTRQLMDAWGKAAQIYGLIHADLGADANLLFWRGQPRPIDFEASGFGYWMYDLATAIAHHVGLPTYSRMWDALYAGYAEERSLPQEQLVQLDLFTAAFYVYYILWMVGIDHLNPGCLYEDQKEIMQRGATFILRFVEKG